MKSYQSVLLLVSAVLISSIDTASIGDRSTEAPHSTEVPYSTELPHSTEAPHPTPDNTHEKLMKLDLDLSALTNLAMMTHLKAEKRVDPVDHATPPSNPFARMAADEGVHTVSFLDLSYILVSVFFFQINCVIHLPSLLVL